MKPSTQNSCSRLHRRMLALARRARPRGRRAAAPTSPGEVIVGSHGGGSQGRRAPARRLRARGDRRGSSAGPASRFAAPQLASRDASLTPLDRARPACPRRLGRRAVEPWTAPAGRHPGAERVGSAAGRPPHRAARASRSPSSTPGSPTAPAPGFAASPDFARRPVRHRATTSSTTTPCRSTKTATAPTSPARSPRRDRQRRCPATDRARLRGEADAGPGARRRRRAASTDDDRRGDPLRRPQRRRRDQHELQLRRRATRCRQVPTVCAAIRKADERASWSSPRPATRSAPLGATGRLAGGRAEGVIGVGATTEGGCLAGYSTTARGSTCSPRAAANAASDRVAPDLHDRRGPDPPGHLRVLPARLHGARRKFAMPPDYVGTSMAAAHVERGRGAVIAERHAGPDPDPSAVAPRLECTARAWPARAPSTAPA